MKIVVFACADDNQRQFFLLSHWAMKLDARRPASADKTARRQFQAMQLDKT